MIANIYFGSTEATKENMSQRVNPYSGEVVSKAPICDEDDAKIIRWKRCAAFQIK